MSKKINAGKNAENNATAKNEVVENEQTVINTELVENAPVPAPVAEKNATELFNARFPAEKYAELHNAISNTPWGYIEAMKGWTRHLSIDLIHLLKFAVLKTADFKRVSELKEFSKMENFHVISSDLPTEELGVKLLRQTYMKLKKSVDSFEVSTDGKISIVSETFVQKSSVQLKNTLYYTSKSNITSYFKSFNKLYKYNFYNIMEIARDMEIVYNFLCEKYAGNELFLAEVNKLRLVISEPLINSGTFNCNTNSRGGFLAIMENSSYKYQEKESLWHYIQRFFNEKFNIMNVSEYLLCMLETNIHNKVAGTNNNNEKLLLNA